MTKRIDSNGNFISIIESTKYAKRTPVYIAPEVFMTNESSKESDVYAFGILLKCSQKQHHMKVLI